MRNSCQMEIMVPRGRRFEILISGVYMKNCCQSYWVLFQTTSWGEADNFDIRSF